MAIQDHTTRDRDEAAGRELRRERSWELAVATSDKFRASGTIQLRVLPRSQQPAARSSLCLQPKQAQRHLRATVINR
jgi:hypothetical protein